MIIFLVCLGVAAIVLIGYSAIHYHYSIKHGKCPVCGSKIEPLMKGNLKGWECTECEWWEAVDETDGTVY